MNHKAVRRFLETKAPHMPPYRLCVAEVRQLFWDWEMYKNEAAVVRLSHQMHVCNALQAAAIQFAGTGVERIAVRGLLCLPEGTRPIEAGEEPHLFGVYAYRWDGDEVKWEMLRAHGELSAAEEEAAETASALEVKLEHYSNGTTY